MKDCRYVVLTIITSMWLVAVSNAAYDFAQIDSVNSDRQYDADSQQREVSLTFDGKIISVEKHNLTVSAGGEQKTFSVAADAMIMVNGTEAKLDDLQTGFLVKVVADQSGEQLIAKVVDARMPQ